MPGRGADPQHQLVAHALPQDPFRARSPMRQLGAFAVSRASPKLTHGAVAYLSSSGYQRNPYEHAPRFLPAKGERNRV